MTNADLDKPLGFWVPDYACETKEIDHGIKVVRYEDYAMLGKRIANIIKIIKSMPDYKDSCEDPECCDFGKLKDIFEGER